MPVDPRAPIATDDDTRLAARLADVERRLATVERSGSPIQQGTGAPSSSPRDGVPYVDQAAPRLYLRVAGAWRYVTLT